MSHVDTTQYNRRETRPPPLGDTPTFPAKKQVPKPDTVNPLGTSFPNKNRSTLAYFELERLLRRVSPDNRPETRSRTARVFSSLASAVVQSSSVLTSRVVGCFSGVMSCFIYCLLCLFSFLSFFLSFFLSPSQARNRI